MSVHEVRYNLNAVDRSAAGADDDLMTAFRSSEAGKREGIAWAAVETYTGFLFGERAASVEVSLTEDGVRYPIAGRWRPAPRSYATIDQYQAGAWSRMADPPEVELDGAVKFQEKGIYRISHAALGLPVADIPGAVLEAVRRYAEWLYETRELHQEAVDQGGAFAMGIKTTAMDYRRAAGGIQKSGAADLLAQFTNYGVV